MSKISKLLTTPKLNYSHPSVGAGDQSQARRPERHPKSWDAQIRVACAALHESALPIHGVPNVG